MSWFITYSKETDIRFTILSSKNRNNIKEGSHILIGI